MIQYVSSFDDQNLPPTLMKQYVLDGSVEMSASIDASNSEALAEVPEDVIEEHKSNILLYIKNISASIDLPVPGTRVESIYPITHWDQIIRIANQLCDIWYWQNLNFSSGTISEVVEET